MKFFRFAKRYPRKSSRKYARKSSVAKTLRKARATSFRKKVLSVISKTAEDKHAVVTQGLTTVADVPTSAYTYQLVPSTSVGTGDNARIGDEITAKSLSVKLSLNHRCPFSINVDDHTYYGIRVMVVQPRQFRGLTQIQGNTDTWLSGLLRDGGSKIAWARANPKSMFLPLNTDDLIVYHDKKYFEHNPRINASATLPTSYIYSIEQTKKTIREMSLNLKVKNKKFKYDPNVNSGLTPVNYNPILIVGVCNMNGYTNATADTGMQITYVAQLTYEDV